MPKKKSSVHKNKASLTINPLVLVVGICLAVLFFFGGKYLFDRYSLQSDLSQTLTSGWQEYLKDKPNFPGGLAMQIISPKGSYFISTGMGKEMTNTHHFRIASTSKTFTAAAIMLLNQKGQLNIDDKVTDIIPGKKIPYLPDSPIYNLPYKKDITIRMLLMHRAGIFDLSNNIIPNNLKTLLKPYVGQNYIIYTQSLDDNHTFTFDELAEIVSTNHLSFFKPGESYHYSDTGYSILGKIIERVTEKSYAEFIKDEILIPNGLYNTIVVDKGTDQMLPESFVKGYIWTAGESAEVTKSNMSPHLAEGSIISTPGDLAKWGKRLFTGQAGLTKGTVAMMMAGEPKVGGEGFYGLGISYNSDTRYGHSGAHQGYLTLMNYNPKTGVVYSLFTNTWDCKTCSKSLDSIVGELKTMENIADKALQKLDY